MFIFYFNIFLSRKEVSNSSVLWSDDAPIQFDVKTVQSYATTATSGQSQSQSSSSSVMVIGYDQSLCRISVRKELRGGKSYQKIGYVDYNLTDFISKYHETMNAPNPENEFCVNRILKEYDTTSGSSSTASKKNQQRLDNSYLKIKIKIVDSNLPPSQLNVPIGQPMSANVGQPPTPPTGDTSGAVSNSMPTGVPPLNTGVVVSQSSTNQSPSLLVKSIVNSTSAGAASASNTTSTNNNSNNNTQNYTPTHSRHSSSSTCNSILINNNLNNSSLSSVFVNGHYRLVCCASLIHFNHFW